MSTKLEVRAASGYATGYSLTTNGNASGETTNDDYDADTEKVINFLHTLPCGTVDRVFTKLKKEFYKV